MSSIRLIIKVAVVTCIVSKNVCYIKLKFVKSTIEQLKQF